MRLVGAQLWDPPAEAPAWLDEPGDPWVLVTTSTDYQADEELARVAVEALRDEPMRVLLTLADAYDTVSLPPAQRARGALRRARAGARARRRRGHPQRHGHRAEGDRRRRADRGRAVRRDQPEVARRVVEAGAGVQLRTKDLSPEELVEGDPAARRRARWGQPSRSRP